MKLLFMISHPAHFHMFRYTIDNLRCDGHKVVTVIRPKDVLEDLCHDAGMQYIKVKDRPRKGGMIGLGLSLIEKIWEVWRIARREKPDLLVGSDGVLAVVGKLIHKPSFEWFEDDVNIIKLYAWLFFPLYTNVVSPSVCDAGKWSYKQIVYPGYQKLAYLHPKRFTPERKVVEKYFPSDKPYFLVRFSQLSAHHDQGVQGFNTETAQRVIEILSAHGMVYLTSEKPLPSRFESYRLRIDPLDIHHILAFAQLYVGDSQSMTVEACMLGTPALRFNDFVGEKKISVLEELEYKYGLTCAVHSSQPDRLYGMIEKWLAIPDLREEWQRRREIMLADKIDVTAFYTWFLEGFPQTREVEFNDQTA